MKELQDDDYLIEITIRLAVHKEHATSLLSIAGPLHSEHESEEDRIINAVLEIVEELILDHNCLDYRASSIGRIPTVKLFDDFCCPGDLAG